MIDKAMGEEKKFNWIKAASYYDQAKKEFFNNNEVYQAANACKSQGYAYARAAETGETATEYKEFNESSIKCYNEAVELFSQINAIPEKLVCEAESSFVSAFISPSISEMLQAFEKAHKLFLESNEVYSIAKDSRNIIHTYARAAMSLSNLILYYSNPDDIKRIRQEGKVLVQKAWKLAKENGDASSLSQSLFAEFILSTSEWFIKFSKSSYWKKIVKEFILLIEEAIPVIEANDNSTFLEMSYFVAGVVHHTFGFQFIENAKEQEKFADKGFEYFKKAEILNKKTKNKLLLTLTISWIDWWCLFWGRLDDLQNRIYDDLHTVENIASILYGSFNHFNFRANFLPTFIYANFAQRSFFTTSQRRSFAEKTNEYGKECLRIIPAYPISLWPLQMLTWAYSQLTILASTESEKQKNAQTMLQHAKQGEKLAKNYEGFARAAVYSSLYRAYQTLANISDNKKDRIQWLSNAIDAMEKYVDYAVESRTGIIIAKVRAGLLYGELNLLTGDSNPLIKSKEIFVSVLDECDERGYLSYSAAASEYLAHVEDSLGNYKVATEHYKRAQAYHSQSLENIAFKPLRDKIIEKVNYTNAWALIERAKAHHKREDQQQAKEDYFNASSILTKLPNHSYEAPYFAALALQEDAEQLSTVENYEESKAKFQKSRLSFENALDAFNKACKDRKDSRERDRIHKFTILTKIRITYCSARFSIENAQILWKKGDLLTAAEQMNLAASQFSETFADPEIKREQENFEAFNILCRAWEGMIIAEKHSDHDKFLEAADLFTKAVNLVSDSRIKLLASGNAVFCQSLANGCKFDESSNFTIKEKLYTEIKSMLRNAASFYQKGGFVNASGWALAMSTYFDATWYLIRADNEIILDEKERILKIGSSYLKSAAELFSKNGYKEKEYEVLARLSMVNKEEQILVTAINTIKEPSISRSTRGMSASTSLVETSLSSRMNEIRRFTEEARRVITQKKYQLIHKDFIQKFQKRQRRQFKVAIAQIGVSETGEFLSEFYNRKASGLIGLKQNKFEFMRARINQMLETARTNGVNVLIFPELTIDLNYDILLEEISTFSKIHGMYIIPGSYHNDNTKQNLSVVISPDGILWKQIKHIPAIIHIEGQRITEEINVGELVHKTFICNTEFGRIAIAICRDFLDMDLRVELKNSEPPVDLIINPAFTPVTADFKAAHFDARRSIYAYCFFANVAEFGQSLIYTPEKERIERSIPPKEEGLIIKEIDLFKLRSERKRWEIEQRKTKPFIQSTR
ncbi:MAG: carbon-nitrogen hydrolase family protein [Candidatus Hodarchaeales archaeon]